jgi:uncharacterized protein (TIGR02453 family)
MAKTTKKAVAEFAFSRGTFGYFEAASRHVGDREWFEGHREEYAKCVEVPLTHLVVELGRELGALLPGIAFSPRKISKPLLRRTGAGKMTDEDGPAVRTTATAFFSEPATSMFETNPGIYVSVGAGAEDNIIGCGLYMPSSRQIKALRPAFVADYTRIDAILRSRTLKKYWHGLNGDRYVRFPKGFEEGVQGTEYLWHKQWLLSKRVSRDEVMAPTYVGDTVRAFKAAMPFVAWTRETVGVYKKPAGGYGRERARS